MSGILCVETATEACSVAVALGDEILERHTLEPRRHNQRLFQFLDDILPQGDIREQGVVAVAYGSGPGSFTGLRVASSFAQGLAYACQIPAIPLSTLAVLAQTALNTGVVCARDVVLVSIDARIDEVYSAVCRYQDGLAVVCEGPWVSSPKQLPHPDTRVDCVVGSGCRYFMDFPPALRRDVERTAPALLPRAVDMLGLAGHALSRGATQSAYEVQPVYVQDKVGWKKLNEQGRNR